MQVFKYVSMQTYRYKSMPACVNACMQLFTYISMQVCKCSSMQALNYAIRQVHRYLGICKYEYMQICK